ncbi:trehalase-like [Dendronephthya gigantea]|uniref:trehalase-like n=1 Tax=Dendronephthya gigantea TaxID=151771 RepID=UPI00106DA359|nr:trehalase-like [Dendronephthya gigantea]
MNGRNLLAFSAFICALLHLAISADIYACDNQVFCQGKILHEVQMAKIFADAKTFVDMRMKHDITDITRNFTALGLKPSKEKIRKFVADNFSPAGEDLDPFDPEDLVEKPKRLKKIRDEKLCKFAFALNALWKKLGRNITHEARVQSERSSLIIVPNPFIVPGGRFREYYYWDSYWILHGILTCGMHGTAKGMIMNYLDLVRRFGFVPNGGRIYYLNRSQPPFLIQMVDLYYSYTKDLDFVRKNLKILEKEYEFWEKHRTVSLNVSGVQHSFAIYNANMTTPRPESYWNDYEVGEKLTKQHMKWRFYQAVASAAESGWDFSSRWFNQSDDEVGKFESIHTMKIIPVDLNSILYKNAVTLSKFSGLTGDQSKSKKYQQLANRRWSAIEALLWNEAAGAWADYDVTVKSNTKAFYASVVVPLWAGLAQENATRQELVFQSMKRAKVLDFPGGFPTSLNLSGQQWDYPNAWPPLQHMLIIGLANCSSMVLQNEAKKLAQSWVLGNWKGYERTKYMFEKYNVTSQGNTGRGGEYKPQVGFGWTNGVILDLLVRFPDIKIANNGIKFDVAMFLFWGLVTAPLLLNYL